MRRSWPAMLLALASLVGALTVTGAAPARACLADNFYVQTYDVRMSPEQTTYTLGETAMVDVEVVRPADTDPAGQGISIPVEDRTPAGGVYVSVGLTFPKGRAFGWGTTDASGRVTVPVYLNPTRLTPGLADASAYAWTENPVACTRVDEYGQAAVEDFLTATAP